MESCPSAASPGKRKSSGDCTEGMQREGDLPARDDERPEDSPKKTKTSGNVSEERHFYRLFNKMLDCIVDEEDVSDDAVNAAISFIVSCFNFREGGRFSDIDFRQTDNLCGYLYRYAPHGAGLTRCRVLEAVRNCQELESSLRKNDLRVVSLGGGPGNDAIGLCSALCQSQFAGRLEVTVVDAVREWSSCVHSAKHFLKRGDFGDVSELFRQDRVTMTFLRATLPGNPIDDDACFVALENADVLLISKLISILNSKDVTDLIENLFLTIKDSALVLLIDSPFWEDEWNKFEVLYLSAADQVYQSSIYTDRFDRNDRPPQSKARIAVMRRRVPQPVQMTPTLNLADSDQ